ncbi:reverse transcriptase domain-containing protein, partial [Tanacetum coccineum]
KKGGITVVTNERNELVLTRTVTGWRRCMLAIFHDMIEESLEAFMDDFSIFGSSFDHFGAILGQKDGNNFHPIYFASKTLNTTQQNYTITKKELMALVFAFDKFRSYLILLLQEFDIELKDRKGTENVAADHLSRIENDETSDDSEVDDNFPGDTLMEMNTKDEPWFADFANYLVSDIIPKGITY